MRWLVGIVVLLLAVGVSAGADVPQSVSLPTWAVGDMWVYQLPDVNVVTWTVIGADADGYTATTSRGTPLQALTVKIPRNLDWTTLTATDGSRIQRDQGSLRFPMTVGSSWPATHPSVLDTVWQDTYTVTAYEKVTVPAGTFDAFRIEGTESNLSKGQARSVVSGTGHFTVWYASEVKWHIKISWDTTSFWHPSIRGKQQVLMSYHVSR